MPVEVNLRHLEAHSIRLDGEVPVSELDLDLRDDMVRADRPLRYDIEVQKIDHSLLVQGWLRLALTCQCVRCLKTFPRELAIEKWSCLLPLRGEESVPVVNDCVDLTPQMREDILLEFPRHPLCKPDCRGLPRTDLGHQKTTGPAGHTAQKVSAWSELDKLKF